MAKNVELKKLRLVDVRLSFPSLYEREKFKDDKGDGKYAATFLIDKDDKDNVNKIKKEVERQLKASGVKVKRANICLRDGDEAEIEGYEDCYSIKAKSNKRPTTIDRDKEVLAADDEKFYPGCRVNAIISLWVQDNDWGKRINATLWGVQFSEDDEAFGMGNVDVTEDFDDLDDLDESDEGGDDLFD